MNFKISLFKPVRKKLLFDHLPRDLFIGKCGLYNINATGKTIHVKGILSSTAFCSSLFCYFFAPNYYTGQYLLSWQHSDKIARL